MKCSFCEKDLNDDTLTKCGIKKLPLCRGKCSDLYLQITQDAINETIRKEHMIIKHALIRKGFSEKDALIELVKLTM